MFRRYIFFLHKLFPSFVVIDIPFTLLKNSVSQTTEGRATRAHLESLVSAHDYENSKVWNLLTSLGCGDHERRVLKIKNSQGRVTAFNYDELEQLTAETHFSKSINDDAGGNDLQNKEAYTQKCTKDAIAYQHLHLLARYIL